MQNEHLLAVPFYAGLNRDFHNHLPLYTGRLNERFVNYAVNYAHTGRLYWEMEGHTRRILAAPVVWWTVSGVRYIYGALDGESWDHRYASFNGPRAATYVTDGLLLGDLSVPHYAPVFEPQTMRELWDELFYWLDAPAPDGTARSWRDARSVLALERLLLFVQSQPRNTPALNPTQEIIARWREAIRQNPHKVWTVAQGAQELGFSSGHLRRVFKAHTGVTPTQFVTQCRLENAAALLKTTALPIGSVAHQTGFDDIAYFSRLFRRRYGMSPTRYRREAQLA